MIEHDYWYLVSLDVVYILLICTCSTFKYVVRQDKGTLRRSAIKGGIDWYFYLSCSYFLFVILALTNTAMETRLIWIDSSCLLWLTYFEDVVTMSCVNDNSCGCSNKLLLNRMWAISAPHVAVQEKLLCICTLFEVHQSCALVSYVVFTLPSVPSRLEERVCGLKHC